jgi:hypothetical protein
MFPNYPNSTRNAARVLGAPSPDKSPYRHVGFGRFPVSGNAVYQAESAEVVRCEKYVKFTQTKSLIVEDNTQE